MTDRVIQNLKLACLHHEFDVEFYVLKFVLRFGCEVFCDNDKLVEKEIN